MARFLSALALSLTLLAIPASAQAGTYTVRACFEDGSSTSWDRMEIGHIGAFGPSTNGCVSLDGGLMAEGWPMNDSWNLNDAFGWSFTAPPTTRITAFQAEVDGWSGTNRVTIAAPWFRGFWDPSGTESWPQEVAGWQMMGASELSLAKLAFGLRCPYSGCGFPGWQYTDVPPFPEGAYIWRGDFDQLARMRRVTITLRDDIAPTIEVVRALPGGARRENVLPVSFTATDNVGVHKLAVLIDGKEAAATNRSCYVASLNIAKQPCAGAAPALEANLELAGLADGAHDVRLVAVDVAGNRVEHPLTLTTDREAPSAPRALQLNGGAGWRAANRFDVQWVGTEDADGAEYELCPAANAPRDTSGCVTGRRSGAGLARIEDLAVPGSGAWRLRLALRDAAGNVDWDRSDVLEGLRLDENLPMAAFLPFDPADPARVRLAASDDSSGVARVEIEARRRGESVWRTLPTSAMLDDSVMRAGSYDLRAHVTDNAGNVRTTTAESFVRLPIRSATKLTAGKRSRSVAYGTRPVIRGKLTGAPRRARIDVLEAGRRVATVRTTRTGTFSYRARSGTARALRFSYPGTALIRPSAQDVDLRVRAGVTLAPSPGTVRNGDTVTFRGRVLSGPLPAGGKLVALQAKTAHGWQTFANPRARASDGRFSARYRFRNTPVTKRYTFRVVVPVETSYPYARGASALRTVLVRG